MNLLFTVPFTIVANTAIELISGNADAVTVTDDDAPVVRLLTVADNVLLLLMLQFNSHTSVDDGLDIANSVSVVEPYFIVG